MQPNRSKTYRFSRNPASSRRRRIGGCRRHSLSGFVRSCGRRKICLTVRAGIAALVPLLFACSDLERSNPLDPKNPKSWTHRVVLIEAFVNDIGGASMEAAVAGLQRLARSYPADRFMLLEHHIQKTAGSDSLSLPASLTRYQTLAPQPAGQAIPDVFFNGPFSRVQGASDAEAAFNRYAQAMDSALPGTAHFIIEAAAVLDGARLQITAKLARLGAEDAEEVAVYAALTSRVYPARPVVRAFLPVEAPGHLDAGEIWSFDRTIDLVEATHWIEPSCILIVQNSRTLHLYHCAQAELQVK